MTALIAIARCRRSAVRNSRNSTRQPDFSTRKKSSMRHLGGRSRRCLAASFAEPTLSVLSRNHSTGSSSSGGEVSTTWTADTVTRFDTFHGLRCRQRDAAEAQFTVRQPLAARGSSFLPAGLGSRRQPVYLDIDPAIGRAAAQGREQLRLPLAENPVVLRAHQQLHPRRAALCVEQFKNVRFPIAHGNHPRPAPTSRTARAMSVKPSSQRRVFRRASAAAGRFTTGSKPSLSTPSGRPRFGHRQRRVQVQTQALRPGLVLADQLQAVAARTGGKVQIRTVPDRQHRALAADPLHAALTMRRQDVLHRDRRLHRHLDQPVERIDRGAVAGAVGIDLLPGVGRQKPHTLHQPRRQAACRPRVPLQTRSRPNPPRSNPRPVPEPAHGWPREPRASSASSGQVHTGRPSSPSSRAASPGPGDRGPWSLPHTGSWPRAGTCHRSPHRQSSPRAGTKPVSASRSPAAGAAGCGPAHGSPDADSAPRAGSGSGSGTPPG